MVWFDLFYFPVSTISAIYRSQILVHADEQTQVHSSWSSLVVTHPSKTSK